MKPLKDFKCNRCGACCYSPRISKKDIEGIEKRYKHKKEDFIEASGNGFYYMKLSALHFIPYGVSFKLAMQDNALMPSA